MRIVSSMVRFVRTMLLWYVHSVVCDASHERDWLLTLYHLDCFLRGLQMSPVHLGLMLVGVVDEDCVKIVRFGPTLLLYGKFNGPFATRVMNETGCSLVPP
jgi:hypothetical protein